MESLISLIINIKLKELIVSINEEELKELINKISDIILITYDIIKKYEDSEILLLIINIMYNKKKEYIINDKLFENNNSLSLVHDILKYLRDNIFEYKNNF